MKTEHNPVYDVWNSLIDLFTKSPGRCTWFTVFDDGKSLKSRISMLDPNLETLGFTRNPVGQITFVKYSPLYKATLFVDDIHSESALGIRTKSMKRLAKCLDALSLSIDDVVAV
jgi:hypothetical protein